MSPPGGGPSVSGGFGQSPNFMPKTFTHGREIVGSLGKENSTLGIGGRFQYKIPIPPPPIISGTKVVWCLLSVVVTHSLAVKVPWSVCAVNPEGIEVTILVIKIEVLLVVGLSTGFEDLPLLGPTRVIEPEGEV